MWFSWGRSDIEHELHDVNERLDRQGAVLSMIARNTRLNLEADMATNDELGEIRDDLQEAFAELSPLPGKIDELLAQVGDQADPALVAEIKGLAQNLADVVTAPSVPDPEVDPEV